MRRWIPFVLGAALSAGPLVSQARADDSELVQVLAESASTPKEHAALAGYYEREAAAARTQAEHHRAMGKAYAATKFFDVLAMREHCEKLASLYEAQAKEFDALAQAHRAHAK